ncbi:MAG: DNA-directed RNA polymerase subunit alpha [Candidatus Pacebacteria bacterium]|nr:DNA-directed RNA polymerase subunit alpha [Candidatus Paceibacterota bacterium]
MILLPTKPKILNEKDNWASFEIENLYPGYGITIGNSLRRVLLSSLEGAAVTQVKIKGVQHEFSTIGGVLEDMIIIIMNLKKMRFKMHSDEPQKAVLKIKGEREIKGSDFDIPSQVELVNKSCHIATITDKKTELEMEIQIEKGIGYESVQQRKKKEKLEIGVIPIDAIFTPVERVSFKVENMRVGDRTDFDRLTLNIQTDGTISPQEAFLKANDILLKHFSLFCKAFVKEEPVKEESEKESQDDAAKIKIEDLKISSRTLNVLSSNNIKNVSGLLKKGEESLMKLEGMGEKGIKEIKKALKKINLELKSKE